jgi:thiamine pyrophosphate-dependent acetolactate synthase large subunit-like protein
VIADAGSTGRLAWQRYPDQAILAAAPLTGFAAWAQACGGFGVRVDAAADLAGALRAALEHDGPALVDVAVDGGDPSVPRVAEPTSEPAPKLVKRQRRTGAGASVRNRALRLRS